MRSMTLPSRTRSSVARPAAMGTAANQNEPVV
jgi:hypothetical protein